MKFPFLLAGAIGGSFEEIFFLLVDFLKGAYGSRVEELVREEASIRFLLIALLLFTAAGSAG